MHISPSLALILSLAACEHASNATSSSTVPSETAPAAPAAAEPTPAAPAPVAATPEAPPPAAAMVAPKPEPAAPAAKTVAPKAKPSVLTPDCRHYRATRAAPKWNADCERPRVTKKPAFAGDPAPAALPEARR